MIRSQRRSARARRPRPRQVRRRRRADEPTAAVGREAGALPLNSRASSAAARGPELMASLGLWLGATFVAKPARPRAWDARASRWPPSARPRPRHRCGGARARAHPGDGARRRRRAAIATTRRRRANRDRLRRRAWENGRRAGTSSQRRSRRARRSHRSNRSRRRGVRATTLSESVYLRGR